MEEIDLATDTLAAYLLKRCSQSLPKEVCNDLSDKYADCEICLDEILKVTFPILNEDEKSQVERIVKNGLPNCSRSGCPI